jgi:hypothetical protein
MTWVASYPCLDCDHAETGMQLPRLCGPTTYELVRTARNLLMPLGMKQPVALPSLARKFGGETWEEKRERLDAEWQPLVDAKHRKVHGYAHIEEIPAHLLGRELRDVYSCWTVPDKAFGVKLIATRDGAGFGAIPRTTWHATREEALAYARKALVQQGKHYAKKYGAAS